MITMYKAMRNRLIFHAFRGFMNGREREYLFSTSGNHRVLRFDVCNRFLVKVNTKSKILKVDTTLIP